MYKPDEQIDWIVLPIPRDFSPDSKLSECISTSNNVLRLFKRMKLKTVQDLIDLPYEEIGTLRARVDQKTIVHSVKQELEEYFSPDLVEKDRDNWGGKKEEVLKESVEIPDDALAAVNGVLRAQYQDELRAYHLQDIWRNRYVRIHDPKPRCSWGLDGVSRFTSALGVLTRGLDAALIAPVDRNLLSRRWFEAVVKDLCVNPLRDFNTAAYGVDDRQNALANYCVQAFKALLKWSRAVKVDDASADRSVAMLKSRLEEVFRPRKGAFGIIINPEVDIVSTIRELLFPKGVNPQLLNFFETIAALVSPVDFLPRPRRPELLKRGMPREKALSIVSRANEIRAKREARRRIEESGVHDIYIGNVRLASQRDLIAAIREGEGNSLFAALRLSLTVDSYAHWNDAGAARHYLVDERRQQEIVELSRRIVEMIESLEGDLFPLHRRCGYASVREFFLSYEELYEYDLSNAMSAEVFDQFILSFRAALDDDDRCQAEEDRASANAQRELRQARSREVGYLTEAQEMLDRVISVGISRHGVTKYAVNEGQIEFLSSIAKTTSAWDMRREWERLANVGFERHEFVQPRSVVMAVAAYPFSEAFFRLHADNTVKVTVTEESVQIEEELAKFMCSWRALASIVTMEFSRTASAARLTNAVMGLVEAYDMLVFGARDPSSLGRFDKARDQFFLSLEKFSVDVVIAEKRYAETLPAASPITDREILDAGGRQDVIDYMNSDPVVGWRKEYYEFVTMRRRFAESGQAFEPGYEERVLSFIMTRPEEILKDMCDLHGVERDMEIERTDDYKRKALCDLMSIMSRYFGEEKARCAKAKQEESLIEKGRKLAMADLITGKAPVVAGVAQALTELIKPKLNNINRNINRHGAEALMTALRTEGKIDMLMKHEEVPAETTNGVVPAVYRCRAKGVKLEMLKAAYAIYERDPHPGTAASRVFMKYDGCPDAYSSKPGFTKAVFDYCRGMDLNKGIAPGSQHTN